MKLKNRKKSRVPQSMLLYRIARAIAWVVSKVIFRRRVLRNELKGVRGPFMVIANHQAALDFVNLLGSTRTPMTFVISRSFYNTLPIKGFLRRMGVIPKQQFQTSPDDLKKMRSVIAEGRGLAIYPAGLMSEDGLSTPIPTATYRFLQWIGADIYVARTAGTYFSMPKWRKTGLRRGRTTIDIYKLFSKEEVAGMTPDEIRAVAEPALLFDAYREQEELRVKYTSGNNIEGLENVLYLCPHCRSEFSMRVKNSDTIYCLECGYAERADELGFLHLVSEVGEEIRYPSDWSRLIYRDLRERIESGEETAIVTPGKVRMIDEERKKFVEVGEGRVTLTDEGFRFIGTVHDALSRALVSTVNFASLPFCPGEYFEIQHADDIFRIYPIDGHIVMKIINAVKVYYELRQELPLV